MTTTRLARSTETVAQQLHSIQAKLEAVYDPSHSSNDRVQEALDIVVTNDLPFLIDFVENYMEGR